MCVGALLASDVDGARLRRPQPRRRRRRDRAPAGPASRPRPAPPGRQRDPPRRGRGALRRARSPPSRPVRRADAGTIGPSGLGRGSSGILSRGEVSEWLMVPLSKSGVRKHRGFESHPLRQILRPMASRSSLGPRRARADRAEVAAPGRAGRGRSSAERSPSGLGRRTGNAVQGNLSRVQIPPSPPTGPRADGVAELASSGRWRRGARRPSRSSARTRSACPLGVEGGRSVDGLSVPAVADPR